MRRRAWRHGWLAGLSLAVPALARAQEAPAPETVPVEELVAETVQQGRGDRTIFTPADFARFAPRTALDMLRQVPGFIIDDPQQSSNFGGGGNNAPDARGLGQASGNVLLNGARFTSKSDSLSNQLARIAASDVERIELVDGAALDLPGLSGRVANVVARNTGGLSGQFEWLGELRGKYAPSTLAGFVGSITGSSGPLSYVLAVKNDPFHGGADGYNIVSYAGGLVENRSNSVRPVRHRTQVSGSAALAGAGGWSASLGGNYEWEDFSSIENEFWLPFPGAAQASDIVLQESPEESYELNGEFALPLGPGRLTLIGLFSNEDDSYAQQQVIDPGTGAPAIGTRFQRAASASERIVRAEYGWPMLGGDWQMSGEAAYNSLDQVATLATLAPNGMFNAAPFLPGTGKVSEDRYEALLFHGRPLAAGLTMQVTLGGEFSEISQSGTNALSRSFLRPKGSVGVAWAARPGTDLSLRLAREVGQLEFEDFLGQVNVGNDTTNAGNSSLRPEQKWVMELTGVQNFGPWGSATLKLFREMVTDYVTIVPLPRGGESIGNIDSAIEYGVNLVGTVRLDPLGVRGAKVDVDVTWQRSSLLDPVTGDNRGYDKYEPKNLLLKFRHDVPRTNWAYGGEYEYTDYWPYYRLAEFGYDYNRINDLNVFIEHKDVFGLTVNLGARNLLHNNVVLDRVITNGPRNRAPFLFSEDRVREVGTIYTFSVKGGF